MGCWEAITTVVKYLLNFDLWSFDHIKLVSYYCPPSMIVFFPLATPSSSDVVDFSEVNSVPLGMSVIYL